MGRSIAGSAFIVSSLLPINTQNLTQNGLVFDPK
jgi:hypothetical protein